MNFLENITGKAEEVKTYAYATLLCQVIIALYALKQLFGSNKKR